MKRTSSPVLVDEAQDLVIALSATQLATHQTGNETSVLQNVTVLVDTMSFAVF